MAKRLSRVLVEQKLVDIATMERAFRHKDHEGGRLGTNLLEIGAIDEKTLDAALSVSREIPTPPAELLRSVDPRAARYISVDDAVNFGVVPLATSGTILKALVKDPLTTEQQALVSARAGFELDLYIVADFRFQYLLSWLYGLPYSNRIMALVERFPREIGLAGEQVERFPREIALAGEQVERFPREIALAGEQVQRAERDTAEIPTPAAAFEAIEVPDFATEPMETIEGALLDLRGEEILLSHEPVTGPAVVEATGQPATRFGWSMEPAEEPGQAPMVAPGHEEIAESGVAVFRASHIEDALPLETIAGRNGLREAAAEDSARQVTFTGTASSIPAGELDLAMGEPKLDRAAAALSGESGRGWTIQQLTSFLDRCQDRDQIIKVFLGFVGGHCPRRCMLAVQKDQLRGFTQEGFVGDPDLIRSIQIEIAPLRRRIRDDRGTGLTVATPHELGLAPLYRTYATAPPPEVVLGVIRINKRPVLVWVADNETLPVSRTAMPSLEKATAKVSAALAQLVFQQKRAGRLQGDPLPVDRLSSTRPEIPRRVLGLRGGPSLGNLVDESGRARSGESDQQSLIDTDRRLEARRYDAPSTHIAATSAAPLVLPSPFPEEDGSARQPGRQKTEAIDREVEDTLDALDRWNPDTDQRATRENTLPGVAGIGSASPGTPADASDASVREPVPGGAIADVAPERVEFGDMGWEEVEQAGQEAPGADGMGTTFGSAVQLIDALVGPDEALSLSARAELVLAGEDALDELKQRFPGPVAAEPGLPSSPHHVSDYGPLLAAVIELGVHFLTRLIELMQSKRRDQRQFATLCCRELLHTRLIHPLQERLFDIDPVIRKIACEALQSYRGHAHFPEVLASLRGSLLEPNSNQQTAAAEALGILVDEESIPYLIELVNSRSPRVAGAAQASLERMVFQSFGDDKRRWLKWYNRYGMQSRDEWLLEGVSHKEDRIRILAADLIGRMPELNLGFDPTGGRREQKRIQVELRRRFGSDRHSEG